MPGSALQLDSICTRNARTKLLRLAGAPSSEGLQNAATPRSRVGPRVLAQLSF